MESVLQSVGPVFREALAKAGALVFVFACLVSFFHPSLADEANSISVARPFATAAVEPAGITPERVRDVARAEVVLGAQATPVATPEPEPVATPEPTPLPTPAPTRAPVVVVATLPPLPDPPTAGIVIASWYGPGFYGNRTACGQTYTPEIIGVAHRTLPCGTLVVLEYRGRTLTVPVIDRGPYIAGRTLDLSSATHIAMGCPDLCTLSMRIGP
ncbi:MAG TPA: septal ring lytic transglycosylase RlpA family protein [Verrucomicrobiae bacterium]|nr:septal ring lytic transglycosylase RlpA family protein [Verrucomicrobiae bacterium]